MSLTRSSSQSLRHCRTSAAKARASIRTFAGCRSLCSEWFIWPLFFHRLKAAGERTFKRLIGGSQAYFSAGEKPDRAGRLECGKIGRDVDGRRAAIHFPDTDINVVVEGAPLLKVQRLLGRAVPPRREPVQEADV